MPQSFFAVLDQKPAMAKRRQGVQPDADRALPVAGRRALGECDIVRSSLAEDRFRLVTDEKIIVE